MKTISIMGINYEVIQLTPAAIMETFSKGPFAEEIRQLVGNEGKNFAGLCDAQNCKIYINIEMPYEKKVKSLIHEFIEAIDQESLTEFEHTKIQSITNALFLSGLLDVSEALKLETDLDEISLDNDTA